jgi:hypothetical protein
MDSSSEKTFETEEAFEEALNNCKTKEDVLRLVLGPVRID